MYPGWDDFCDQSEVCQDISKVPCFVNNTTDMSVLIGFFRNSVSSVKVPCFVNLLICADQFINQPCTRVKKAETVAIVIN